MIASGRTSETMLAAVFPRPIVFPPLWSFPTGIRLENGPNRICAHQNDWLDIGRYNTPNLWHPRKGTEKEGLAAPHKPLFSFSSPMDFSGARLRPLSFIDSEGDECDDSIVFVVEIWHVHLYDISVDFEWTERYHIASEVDSGSLIDCASYGCTSVRMAVIGDGDIEYHLGSLRSDSIVL